MSHVLAGGTHWIHGSVSIGAGLPNHLSRMEVVMPSCVICNHTDAFAYIQTPITKKHICVPCAGVIKDLHSHYILDVAHKGRREGHIHTHRKIQDPDGSMP